MSTVRHPMRNSRGCKGHIRISKVHIVPHLLGIYRELIEYKAPCEPLKFLDSLLGALLVQDPLKEVMQESKRGPNTFGALRAITYP